LDILDKIYLGVIVDKKPEFENIDLVHLKHLKEMVRDNLVLKDVECMDVSKIYHVFQWIETVEEKIKDHFHMKGSIQSFKNEKSELIYKIRQLEIELEEAKKPKRKPRARNKTTKK
jgi:hypothetical protein